MEDQFTYMVDEFVAAGNTDYLIKLKEELKQVHLKYPHEKYIYQIGYLCKVLNDCINNIKNKP